MLTLMVRRCLAAALLLMTLAACGSVDTSDEAAESKDRPAVGMKYSSVSDLMDAAIEAGFPCPSRKEEKFLKGGGYGTCSETSTFSLANTTWETEEELKQAADDLVKELQEDDPIFRGDTRLLGTNWAIAGPADEVKKLQKSLGGVVTVVPDEKP